MNGASLSRPWRVPARLCLLLRSTSLCCALRASLRLFKSAPGGFVTQVVAMATTLLGTSLCLTPSGLTRRIAPGNPVAPERRPALPARRQDPRSTINKAGLYQDSRPAQSPGQARECIGWSPFTQGTTCPPPQAWAQPDRGRRKTGHCRVRARYPGTVARSHPNPRHAAVR